MHISETDFTEIILHGMKLNYETYGHLTPMLFILRHGEMSISKIPRHWMGNQQDKEDLVAMIRQISSTPGVTRVGIVTEAYGATVPAENPFSELLVDGTLRVSELNDKLDLAVLYVGSPEGTEMIAHVVDPATRLFKEEFCHTPSSQLCTGIFSNFFRDSDPRGYEPFK